jgi:hypothetical protein
VFQPATGQVAASAGSFGRRADPRVDDRPSFCRTSVLAII